MWFNRTTYPTLLLTIFWILIGGMGCAKQPPHYPLPFEVAVRIMAEDLFDQVGSNWQNLLTNLAGPVVVIDPIINADTGAVTQISLQAQRIITETASRKLSRAQMKDMTTEHLAKASYLISGVMLTEPFSADAKLLRLKATIVDVTNGRIIANASAWIADTRTLDNTPTPMYRDSPMYIKDRRIKSLIATATATAGESAAKDYFDSLETSALLNEAAAAYDDGNYQLSIGLFAKAAERPDGEVMKTYSGLYQNFIQFGQYQEAEEAFAQLTDIGLASGNVSVRFLFKVNETSFFGPPELLKQFTIWMRQLPQRFMASEQCIDIIGHASRTGSAQYNRVLSQRRADAIQTLMEQQVRGIRQRTRTEGRGFDESTSQFEDPLDRRVEFKIVSC